MDPNETLRRLHDVSADPEERLEAAEDLETWISTGGFLPTYGDAMPDGEPFCDRDWWLRYLPNVLSAMRRLVAHNATHKPAPGVVGAAIHSFRGRPFSADDVYRLGNIPDLDMYAALDAMVASKELVQLGDGSDHTAMRYDWNSWHFAVKCESFPSGRCDEDGYPIFSDVWSVEAGDDLGHRWHLFCQDGADARAKLEALPAGTIPSNETGWGEGEPSYGSEAWDDLAEWRLTDFERECREHPIW